MRWSVAQPENAVRGIQICIPEYMGEARQANYITFHEGRRFVGHSILSPITTDLALGKKL